MKLIDLQKQTATVSSTAVITLGAAAAGLRTVAQAIAAGEIAVGDKGVAFFVRDPATGAFESGVYAITAADTLTRERITSSSSNGTAVNFGGAAVEVYSAAPAAILAALNQTYEIPFSQSVPLHRVGTSYMPETKIAAGMQFSPAAGAVRGALAYLRLVADGANTPTFQGMQQWGSSLDFDPRNGIVNLVQFFCDGVDVWYSIAQAAAAAPVVTKPGAPTIGSASAGDGTASVAFTAPASNGGATISNYTVTAYKASDDSVVNTITATNSPANFTGLVNGVALYFKAAATNSAGTGPQSAASNTVTPAVAAVTYTRLNSLTNVTESGTGPYSYAYSGSGGSWLDGSGGVSNQLAANTDGSIAMTINVVAAANGLLLALSSGSAKVPYTGTLYAVYVNDSDGKYKTITGGNPGTSTASNVAAQVGDILRLRRAGSSLVAEVARSASPTAWTTLRTWTGVTTAAVYFQVDISGAGSIGQNITGVNV